ncbi:hypothetical protein PSTG_06844 [Puccinia striiformis f. sp. tritici PST-78]|uniref:Metallo-beta-lactamase domain-containing protein n=1 Tax=Puccinia striiformis f. sp. tritici PST-78 TaxID=1165861 RepID=A0A0L0VL46_9BASI|nr:hypothetical protein PSTG_06844 [Puccinia striiformis f. sp. tritici PST-78]
MTSNGEGRVEVILLGTGTSSQVPSIVCLTEPEGNGCLCCTSKDRKNLRRNTSALVRIHPPPHHSHSGPHLLPVSNILVDVGKSFCEAARELFPKHMIRKLDAVLLTHPHADAINGLDDLRAWTLGGAIQESIAIYCNEYTHKEIARMFPYLVDSDAKTGGGDVPQFTWNIIQDGTAFDLFGIEILPLPVHHGKFFESSSEGKPYICTSYLIDKTIYYVSDVSMIPMETMERLRKSLDSGTTEGKKESNNGRLKVLIIDTLRLLPHASHFGIAQSIHVAKILNPLRTYLVGFTHRVTHECWTYCCEAISQGRRSTDFQALGRSSSSTSPGATQDPNRGVGESRKKKEALLKQGIVEDHDWFTRRALKLIEEEEEEDDHQLPVSLDKMPWVRPGFDGLFIQTNLSSSSSSATVTDNFDH